MLRVPTVSVSMHELDRLKSIQAVVDGELRSIRAAERLDLTSRQVRRLVALYRERGPVDQLFAFRTFVKPLRISP